LAVFVVDTSALICVLAEEDDSPRFRLAFKEADAIHISMGTVFEASCVARNERIVDGTTRLERLLTLLDPEYHAFDERQSMAAREAYSRYGRGSRHPAGLNIGDCFAYALAKTRNLPLLFKGEDFIHTDIVPALPPV
jgi:ribonuclease VapC